MMEQVCLCLPGALLDSGREGREIEGSREDGTGWDGEGVTSVMRADRPTDPPGIRNTCYAS